MFGVPLGFDRGSSILKSVNSIVSVYQEKIPEDGEDSFCYSLNERACMIGVFDGCGGSGAKKYAAYRNKTGAYMASRAASAAVREWFLDQCEQGLCFSADETASLKAAILRNLTICEKRSAAPVSGLRGSLSKKFPTTAAVAVALPQKGGLQINCYWAGDSRLYLLDRHGLAQLSADDLKITDAFENLSADGTLTNVISLSRDFALHKQVHLLTEPGFVFAASDGCFGYVSTPMEFEYLLLDTLTGSDSPAGWEGRLKDAIAPYAEDDFTLCGFVFDFSSFAQLKEHFKSRKEALFRQYISRLEPMDREENRALWRSYSPGYYRYLQENRLEKL